MLLKCDTSKSLFSVMNKTKAKYFDAFKGKWKEEEYILEI